jgi:hypothetical protein
MRGPAKGENRDRHDRGKDGGQHNENEPGGAVCGLGRGLGDAHGVDKGVRDEKEKLHVYLRGPSAMLAGIVGHLTESGEAVVHPMQ